MSGTHARLSASSAYRWMNCPGSAKLIDEHGVDYTSEYAAEGTAAHELASSCLTDGSDPFAHLGRVIKADGFKFTVDEEMAEAVSLYVEEVRWLVEQHPDSELFIEQSLLEPLKTLHPDFGGTADAMVYVPSNKTLHVYDYKHGAGVLVEVKGNAQLKYYALGALLALDRPVDTVFIEIVQPRCDHPEGPARGDMIPALELIDFAADILDAARAAEDPWAPLKSGDWCKFCPAAHACPELEKHQNALVAADFDVVESLPAERIRDALEILPMVEARIKAVRERAYREAMHGNLPGWKIVEKRATRKWARDPHEVAREMVTGKLAVEDDLYEKKIKSPAQVEKLLGKSKFSTVEKKLVKKESSGYNLVPESDPKPAAMLASTDDFDEVK